MDGAEGKVFQIAADNLTRLQEEIYRVCYLMQQAGRRIGGASNRRLSKQLDFIVTQEVLRAYGDAVKDDDAQGAEGDSTAREDGLTIGVTGLDEFDITDFCERRRRMRRALLNLGIESADSEEAGSEARGAQVSVRCAAGREGSDCGGD